MGEDAPLEEPWGQLSCEHVQLVPQSMGMVTEELASDLRRAYPQTQFRLHANVRVLPRQVFADLSNVGLNASYFAQAARVSKALGAKVYSAHSGSRSHASMAQMLENARRLSDIFEADVAIEGQYPKRAHRFSSDTAMAPAEQTEHDLLVSTWGEYQKIFESGCAYALDLSHLNILASITGQINDTLVSEMLASDRCLEVHVSDNDGARDQHQICREDSGDIWWLPLLKHIHSDSVIFSEGNHRKKSNVAGNQYPKSSSHTK